MLYFLSKCPIAAKVNIYISWCEKSIWKTKTAVLLSFHGVDGECVPRPGGGHLGPGY